MELLMYQTDTSAEVLVMETSRMSGDTTKPICTEQLVYTLQ